MLEIPDTGCSKGKSLSARSSDTGELAKDKTSEHTRAEHPMFFSGPNQCRVAERAGISSAMPFLRLPARRTDLSANSHNEDFYPKEDESRNAYAKTASLNFMQNRVIENSLRTRSLFDSASAA